MTIRDTMNAVFREYRRYTGDGRPDEPSGAPLPVGDPASGVHKPSKAELRTAFGAAGDAVEAAQTAAEAARTHAEEWAAKAEDAPVSVAAGGDNATTFSALHWAAKASASAALARNEFVVDVFSGTGLSEDYQLSATPGSKNNLFVAIDGVLQQRSTFDLSGTTLTLDAPAGVDNIEVCYGFPIVGLPPAAVIGWAGASAPTGFLVADGSAVSRATYAALFAEIGTSAGAGDGSTTFNLPDYSGQTPMQIIKT